MHGRKIAVFLIDSERFAIRYTIYFLDSDQGCCGCENFDIFGCRCGFGY